MFFPLVFFYCFFLFIVYILHFIYKKRIFFISSHIIYIQNNTYFLNFYNI